MTNKRNKGITLIALVLTIVILIILAGVSINLVLGQDGIIARAKNAQIKYEQEAAKEKLSIALLDLGTKKLGEQKRYLLLEELTEIKEDGIVVKINQEDKVEIFTDEEKGLKYAIVISNGYEFKIYENLEIELVGEKKEEETETDTSKYVQDGLIVLYDGKNNTGKGHNNTVATWKNLAPTSEANPEGRNDGLLMNIDGTPNSGWTENSLILDGIDDWVKMSYIYYENMTVEIVAKSIDIDTEKSSVYIANFQNGGIGIWKNISNYNSGYSYIDETYHTVRPEENIEIGKLYSMSTRYNGSELYYSENNKSNKISVIGTNKAPQNSTAFAIGTNPNGTSEELSTGEKRGNIEVYSVRIYNRCLTEEEVQHNYQIDKERFKINEIEEQKELGYINDGLICLYDGERNTQYGHSKANTIWMDLSKNGNDGLLMNIDGTPNSGWTENSLILDGINDWVKMTYIHYKDMTVEIVAKPITLDDKKNNYLLANMQNGGMGIRISSNMFYSYFYMENSYQSVSSIQNVKLGNKYSISTGCNGIEQYLRENEQLYKKSITGKYTEPQSSTAFAIGTNPYGTSEKLGTNEKRGNIEVCSVRIYNRCLTEEEVQHNYQIDKGRFNI